LVKGMIESLVWGCYGREGEVRGETNPKRAEKPKPAESRALGLI